MQSPPMSAGPNGSNVGDPNIRSLQTGPTTPTSYQSTHGSLTPMLNPPSRHSRGSASQSSLPSVGPPSGHGEYHPPQLPPSTSPTQAYSYSPSGQVLPPFSTLQAISHPTSRTSIPGSHDSHQQRRMQRGHDIQSPSGSKRTAPPSSNATSADSTDIEDDNGELPASGLVAPWEVLRGLADVAIERAAKVSGFAFVLPFQHEPKSCRRMAKQAVNRRVGPERRPLSVNSGPRRGEKFVIGPLVVCLSWTVAFLRHSHFADSQYYQS